MNGADILVEMLIGYDVDTVFGVPGDTNVSFYKALRHREDEITHVMARDERSAGYIADAYGRFTNRPAIAECPSRAGPMSTLPPETLCFSERLIGPFRNMPVLVRSSSMKTGADPPCPDEAFIAAVDGAQ